MCNTEGAGLLGKQQDLWEQKEVGAPLSACSIQFFTITENVSGSNSRATQFLQSRRKDGAVLKEGWS